MRQPRTGRERGAREPETPGQKPEMARTAPNAAGDSSLNLENNFELSGLGWGDVDLSYFLVAVNPEPARALFAPEKGPSPRCRVRPP